MANSAQHKKEICENGFTIIGQVFSNAETDAVLAIIHQADTTNTSFRKTKDLFAIRWFLSELPQVCPIIFTERFRSAISTFCGENYFAVKSIYFDKPAASNWFVAYHQDSTIAVEKKQETKGFGPWSKKEKQFAVQPPLQILENNFAVRIHLDDTAINNGALRVIPGSHLKGIYRPESIDWNSEKEVVCNVAKGGIMIMKPLLLHASGRTTNNKKRRVIHIEFSNCTLPPPLHWAELINADPVQNRIQL